jgi:hypothetical protein
VTKITLMMKKKKVKAPNYIIKTSTCLDTAMKWNERQQQCDGVQLLALQGLWDLAASNFF